MHGWVPLGGGARQRRGLGAMRCWRRPGASRLGSGGSVLADSRHKGGQGTTGGHEHRARRAGTSTGHSRGTQHVPCPPVGVLAPDPQERQITVPLIAEGRLVGVLQAREMGACDGGRVMGFGPASQHGTGAWPCPSGCHHGPETMAPVPALLCGDRAAGGGDGDIRPCPGVLLCRWGAGRLRPPPWSLLWQSPSPA